jgi:hypothetical protein
MAPAASESGLDRHQGLRIDPRSGKRTDPDTGSTAEWRNDLIVLHLMRRLAAAPGLQLLSQTPAYLY